jgi:hypothetical protein
MEIVLKINGNMRKDNLFSREKVPALKSSE